MTPGPCGICGKEIKFEFNPEIENPARDFESTLDEAGRVTACFGYGSRFDGYRYKFFICDDCFESILKSGRVTHEKVYLFDEKDYRLTEAEAKRRGIEYKPFIRSDPFDQIVRVKGIAGGAPIIKGTRIQVSVLWELHEKAHMNYKEIADEYPQLSEKQIEQALGFGVRMAMNDKELKT